ncbi:MAG TPA: hypothetical protein VGF26_20695 [Ramlibacter sp.]
MERTASNGLRAALRPALGIAAALALAACSTPYQPKGANGGFTDHRLGAGQYSVEFTGNGNTSAALVANMFMYRCAELTVRDGYDVFRSAPPGTAAPADGFMQPMADEAAASGAQPTEFRSSGTTYVPIYVPSTPRTVTIHRMVGVVRMARYADVPSNMRAWDARAVMKQLEPVVKGGAGKAFTAEEIGRVALVQGRGPAATATSGGGTTLDDLRQLLSQPQE